MRKTLVVLLIGVSGWLAIAGAALAGNETGNDPPKKPEKKELTRGSTGGEKTPSATTPKSVPPLRRALSVLFSGDKVSKAQAEVPLTPPSAGRPPRTSPATPQPVVRGPLCTVIAPHSVMANGYLKVNEGDVITVMDADNVPPGFVIAQKGEEEGRLFAHVLELDKHAANTYLRIADFLVDHPHILTRLLQGLDDKPDGTLEKLVDVLAARNQLFFALRNLFELELQGTQPELLFRLRSPAVILFTAVLNRPGQTQSLRTDFLKKAMSAVKACQRPSDVNSIAEIIRASIEPFSQMRGSQVPPELALVLGALKQVGVRHRMNETQVSVLLGSVFCLRFLVPALAQPKTYLDVSTGSIETLKLVGKAMQLISNQIDPDKDNCLFAVSDAMRALHPQLAQMHDRLSSVRSHRIVVKPSQILNALEVYRRTMAVAKEFMNPAEFEAQLQRLGHPEMTIKREEDAPRYGEIKRIRAQIGKLDPNCLK